MATPAELEAEVRRRYPQYAFLLNNKELRAILLDAVDPSKGFSAQEFEARIQNTAWWKKNGDAFRRWQALVNTNPGEAKRQIEARAAELRDLLGQVGGSSLSAAQMAFMADWTLRYGIQTGSAEMREMIAALIPSTPKAGTPSGSFQATMQEIMRMAKEDYLVPMTAEAAWKWARDVTAGNRSMEGVRVHLANTAKGRFAHLATEIDAGITPGMIFAPYRQMIAQELEVAPQTVDLMDPKWTKVLSHTDGKQVRAMTLAEAQRHVRSQPEWKRTARAQQMAAGFGDQLLRTFGALA